MNSEDCQGCNVARCSPVFVEALLFIEIIIWPEAEAGAAGITQQVKIKRERKGSNKQGELFEYSD